MDEEKEEKNEKIQAQSVTAALGFVFWNSLASIIGYIAIVIFKPFIDWLLKWAKKN
jgi:hypothetical protein